MATTITVSYSELDTFRQCPLKWALGYRDLWSKDHGPGSALDRGSAWHTIMQTHYTALLDAQRGFSPDKWRNLSPARKQLILAGAIKAVRQWFDAQIKAANDEGDTDAIEQLGLLAWMYDGHVQQYGVDEDWKILHVEQAGSIYLPTENGGRSRFKLKYKVDLVVLDLKTNQIKIVDHKTAADFSREVEIDLDDQFGLYTWAWNRQHGQRALAVVRSDARTRRNKGPMALEDRFRRHQTFRSDQELHNIALDAYRAATAAYRGGNPHSAPAPDRCKWRCDFLEVHLAMRKGIAPAETILRDFGFYQREAKHREYTREEGQS